MRVRLLVLFQLLAPGDARSSFRMTDSRDASHQDHTLANRLEVGAEERETLIPAPVAPRAGQLEQRRRGGAPPPLLRRPRRPRRAEVALQGADGFRWPWEGPKFPRVLLEPDYGLSIRFAALAGAASLVPGGLGLPVALPLGALTALLATRTNVVRFLFDTDAIEILAEEDGEVGQSGENFVVGGRNRWRYADITEYAFYPSQAFPVLVYFNERATKESGQGHLFPVLAKPEELIQLMAERIGEDKLTTDPPSL